MSLLIYGNYSRRVNVHGELVSVPRAISLFSESQGYIVKLHVKPGMIVHKGQPLAEINVSRSTFSGDVSERQRETISTQIKTIEYIIVRLRDNRKSRKLMCIPMISTSDSSDFDHASRADCFLL